MRAYATDLTNAADRPYLEAMRVTHNFRKAYSAFGLALLLEFLAQFYVIAVAMFDTLAKEMPFASSADLTQAAPANVDPFAAAHAVSGIFIIPPTILIMVGLSFGARHRRRTTALTAVLFLLVVIQFALAVVGFLGVPLVAGLHGINAIVMVGLGAYLVASNWEFGRVRGANGT